MSNTQCTPLKDKVEGMINASLLFASNDDQRKAMLRAVATFSLVKLASLEGNERAAMAAYALGDHLVDPKMEQKIKKTS